MEPSAELLGILSMLNLLLTLSVIIGARSDRRRLSELEAALLQHDERIHDASRLINRVDGTVSKMDDNLRMVLNRMMRDLNTRT